MNEREELEALNREREIRVDAAEQKRVQREREQAKYREREKKESVATELQLKERENRLILPTKKLRKYNMQKDYLLFQQLQT
jgi:hypothetical protein